MSAEHTPTPWTSGGCVVYGDSGVPGQMVFVADLSRACVLGSSPETVEANTDFICRAVNAHEELVAAGKLVTDSYDNWWAIGRQGEPVGRTLIERLRAALAKAEAD